MLGHPHPIQHHPPSTQHGPRSGYRPSIRRAASHRLALILRIKGGKLAGNAREPLKPDRKSCAQSRERIKEAGEFLMRQDRQEPGNMNEAACA